MREPIAVLPAVSRRGFLKVSSMAGAGFSLACYLPAKSVSAQASVNDLLELNAFVEVGTDGTIRLYAHTPEKGQGVKTSMPMIIAEELGAAWRDVTVVQALVNEARYGQQRAGGSTSTMREFDPMRRAGAAARNMFIAAAAKRLNLDPAGFDTRDSRVIHAGSGASLSFAELALDAAMQPVPDPASLQFRARSDWRLLGTAVTGVDNHKLVTGEASLFGLDIRLPGMLYAVYQKCPATYGTVRSANLDQIKGMAGIVDAFVVEGNDNARELLAGVAIVGTSTWAVFKARVALEVDWDESAASRDDSDVLRNQAMAIVAQAWPAADELAATGDVEAQFSANGNRVIEAAYSFPYIAHAPMEPMNCTVHYHRDTDSMEIWAPSRQPWMNYASMQNLFGIPQERVTIHQMRMGGSFGRRRYTDFSCEAAAIAHRFDVPVKLVWTREQDMMHDQFRPGGVYAMKAALNPQGQLVAMQNHLIGSMVRGQATDNTNLGAAEFPALNISHYRSARSLMDSNTSSGNWRAPGSHHTAWAVQGFIDELAYAAGRDNMDLMVELMGEPRWFQEGRAGSLNTGRALAVIDRVRELSDYGKSLPAGRAQGFAFHFCHNAHVAEVVELSVDDNKRITIHKITAALDVGPIINMSGALNQVEGSMLDGLSTMLGLEVSLKNGRVQQTNFHQYPMLRMVSSPAEIEISFIQSEFQPTGLGEPALPPLAPAVCNAIHKVTGERIRSLPISKLGYTA
jgi:isoquinoline 1-oxidoreductase beta subunit